MFASPPIAYYDIQNDHIKPARCLKTPIINLQFCSMFQCMQDSPALACPAPLPNRSQTGTTTWPELASPQSASIASGPTSRISLSGPSAFSVVPPATTHILPALYPAGLMCLPSILDSLQGRQFFTNSMNAQVRPKPIPNNDNVDLQRFRVTEPVDWIVDDIIAWLFDVAKRNEVLYEDIAMHKFAGLNGARLLQMSEQEFIDRDPTWGSLIFKEFKKLSSSEETLIDDYLKKYNEDDQSSSGASTSFDPKMTQAGPFILNGQNGLNQCFNQSLNQAINQTLQQTLSLNTSLTQTLNPQFTQNLPLNATLNHQLNQSLNHSMNSSLNPMSPLMQGALHLNQNRLAQNLQTAAIQQTINQSLASSLAAGLQTGLSPIGLSLMQNGLSPSSPMLSTIPSKVSPLQNEYKYNPGSVSTDYDADERLHGVESKIKKNKDGKPRKRSQHTKGNKLWEFIRDALKDPETCPSVVKWEDANQGVFRIVESEKLARLWGDRKNNTKMTYEKLSRAMRTYYEKQILVPVPKTGLYPKKLVYKFGPGAHGWDKLAGCVSINMPIIKQEIP